jgi:hypothetical protein
MASPSSIHVPPELEEIRVLNEVLDVDNISAFSLANDSIFDSDHTQLVTSGTHMIVID